MPGLLDRLYNVSPVWLQQVAVSAYGLSWKQKRYSGEFQQAVHAFVTRERYSESDWRHYQTRTLQERFVYSSGQVPYSRDPSLRLALLPVDLRCSNQTIYTLSL